MTTSGNIRPSVKSDCFVMQSCRQVALAGRLSSEKSSWISFPLRAFVLGPGLVAAAQIPANDFRCVREF